MPSRRTTRDNGGRNASIIIPSINTFSQATTKDSKRNQFSNQRDRNPCHHQKPPLHLPSSPRPSHRQRRGHRMKRQLGQQRRKPRGWLGIPWSICQHDRSYTSVAFELSEKGQAQLRFAQGMDGWLIRKRISSFDPLLSQT